MQRLLIKILLLVMILAGCGAKYTEATLKSEIITWWDSEEIDEIIIEDFVRDGKNIEVLAKMVIFNDTTERMTYDFQKFEKGWWIRKGPVEDSIKQSYLDELGASKIAQLNAELARNMHAFQLALEHFSVNANGAYPANLDVKIKDILVGYKGDEYEFTVMDFCPELKNPYFPSEKAVHGAMGDTTVWFPRYRGKVIYFPQKINGKMALGYIIKVSSHKRFLSATIKSSW